jgi:hypothetical protein
LHRVNRTYLARPQSSPSTDGHDVRHLFESVLPVIGYIQDTAMVGVGQVVPALRECTWPGFVEASR